MWKLRFSKPKDGVKISHKSAYALHNFYRIKNPRYQVSEHSKAYWYHFILFLIIQFLREISSVVLTETILKNQYFLNAAT